MGAVFVGGKMGAVDVGGVTEWVRCFMGGMTEWVREGVQC